MKKKSIFLLLFTIMFIISSSYVTSVDVTGTFSAYGPSLDVSMSNPFPSNESWVDIDNHVMNITVTNSNDETMNVSFYWNNNHTLIGTDNNVANNSVANITVGFNYTHYQQYYWYVTVNSTSYNNKSSIWWFKGEAFPWDINRDKLVDNTDRQNMNNTYLNTGTPGWIREDTNGDGKINYLDTGSLAIHYGDDYT